MDAMLFVDNTTIAVPNASYAFWTTHPKGTRGWVDGGDVVCVCVCVCVCVGIKKVLGHIIHRYLSTLAVQPVCASGGQGWGLGLEVVGVPHRQGHR